MKLKDLLSESSLKVLDRKFGEPLPTLEDTKKAYRLKKEGQVNEAKGWDLLKNVYLKFTQHQARRLALAMRKRDIKSTNTIIDLIIGGLSAAKKATKKDRRTL